MGWISTWILRFDWRMVGFKLECPLMRLLPLFATFALVVSPVHGERDPIRLTQGPMLGHVTDSSVRVWVRTSEPGAFSVRFGLSPEGMTGEGKGETEIGSDNRGSVTVEGLLPDARYY